MTKTRIFTNPSKPWTCGTFGCDPYEYYPVGASTPWYETGTYCDWSVGMSETDKMVVKIKCDNEDGTETFIWYIEKTE